MRLATPLILLVLLSACGPGANLGALVDPADAPRRGAVEVAVKASFPAILTNIEAGGGPDLQAAFDAAGVPASDRPARTLQLGGDLGLYAANPAALATTIAAFGA